MSDTINPSKQQIPAAPAFTTAPSDALRCARHASPVQPIARITHSPSREHVRSEQLRRWLCAQRLALPCPAGSESPALSTVRPAVALWRSGAQCRWFRRYAAERCHVCWYVFACRLPRVRWLLTFGCCGSLPPSRPPLTVLIANSVGGAHPAESVGGGKC